RGKRARGVLRQRLDGVVRLALIGQHSRQAQPRYVPQFVVLGIVHDLHQRSGRIAKFPLVDIQARQHQLRLIRIRRGRKILDETIGDLPRLGLIVVLERRRHVVELRGGAQGTVVSVAVVVAIPENERRTQHDAADDPRPVLRNDAFDVFELFIVGQIIFSHGYSAIPALRPNKAPKRSLIRSMAHSSCATSRRKSFSATTPRATSSSPSTIANWAPLLSARLNCVLKLPLPRLICNFRSGQASRNRSANWKPGISVRSPTSTR